MRLAVVHSFYATDAPSGENTVVTDQVAALRGSGHEVQLFHRDTDTLADGGRYAFAAALVVATGVGPSPLGGMRRWEPDVVIVHNLFPNYGRRWVRRLDCPLVAVLHNFRPLCAAGTLERGGQDCTLCVDLGSALPAMRHACYRGSRLATAPIALSTRFAQDPLLRHADVVIALTPAMAEIYVQAGLPSDKLVVIPNFVPRLDAVTPALLTKGGGGGLFVGRLTADKGLDRALTQWPASVPLRVVGSGSDEVALRSTAPESVTFLGSVPRARVRELMRETDFLVFPSRWREGLPTVYLEALEAGLPTLAWPGSVVADLVARDATGLVVDGPVHEAVKMLYVSQQAMSRRAAEVFARDYSVDAWLARMEDTLSSLLSGR